MIEFACPGPENLPPCRKAVDQIVSRNLNPIKNWQPPMADPNDLTCAAIESRNLGRCIKNSRIHPIRIMLRLTYDALRNILLP